MLAVKFQERKEKKLRMAFSFLFRFVFPLPPSIFVTAMSLIHFASLAYTCFSELTGNHLQYSKFWNANKKSRGKEIKISSRNGMLLLYMPAFLAGLASFAFLPQYHMGSRCFLVTSALTVHFLKRVLEVLFVHKYSGAMILKSAIPITISYFLSTVTAIYAQHLSRGSPEPEVDLKYLGIILFLVGIVGNFYHHYLLSKLRDKAEKGYKIPKGGLFSLVICPHYTFEIIGFIGVSFISQTIYSFSFTLGTIYYLTGRSYVTRNWYLSKFPDFPKETKALFPFIF